jgi:hypothetical protein
MVGYLKMQEFFAFVDFRNTGVVIQWILNRYELDTHDSAE